MVVREPQAAGDYDDRTTAAVKSVLIEIGQILGSFEGKFAIIGGAVPWLLLGEAEMPHIGIVDAYGGELSDDSAVVYANTGTETEH